MNHPFIMMRVQVRLSRNQYRAARREARRLGISLSELMRRALRTLAPVDEARPWMRYAGMVQTLSGSSSRCIDEVVYGKRT